MLELEGNLRNHLLLSLHCAEKKIEIFREEDGKLDWVKTHRFPFAHAKEFVLCPGSNRRRLSVVVFVLGE